MREPLELFSTIARYRILSQLGADGMGDVVTESGKSTDHRGVELEHRNQDMITTSNYAR
jgi:hypothetical protein